MLSRDGREALATIAHRPVVITIDLHRGHLDPAVATLPLPPDRSAALLARVLPLLDELRALGVPVIHAVTAYRDRAEILSNRYWAFQAERPGSARHQIAEHNLQGMPGLELMPGVRRESDSTVLTKKRYDCLIGTDLEFMLRSGGHDAAIVVGVNTNSCVIATTIALSVRDYAVFVVDDGVDSMLGPSLHDAAESVIDASFGWIVDGRTVLDVLAARSVPKMTETLQEAAPQ